LHPGLAYLALDLRSDSWLNCDFHCDIKINITANESTAPNDEDAGHDHFSDLSSGLESD
jgi:hypothetical protein